MKPSLLAAILSVIAGLAGWKTGSGLRGDRAFRGDTRPSGNISTANSTVAESSVGNSLISEAIERVIAVGKASGSSSEFGIALFEEAQHFGTADFNSAIAIARHEGNAEIAELLAGYWAERDLDGAKKWMLALDLEMQRRVAAEIAGTWTRANPKEFLDWMDSLPADARKKVVAAGAAQIVRGAGVADAARVAKLLIESPDRREGGGYLGSLFDRWTVSNPKAAAESALSLPLGSNRTAAVKAVAKAWASVDANAAAAWVRGLGDAVLTGRATAAYATGLAAKNPRAAAEFVGSLDATEENIQTFNEIATRWGSSDPNAALTWADAIPDEESRRTVLDKVLTAMASQDPNAAAREFVRRQTEVSDADFNSPIFKITWGLFDQGGMGAVLKFADSLTGFARSLAISRGLNAWASEDLTAASEWVLAHPGEDQGQQLYEIAGQALNGDGTKWARSLPATAASDQARVFVAEVTFRKENDRQRAVEIFSQVSNKELGREKLRLAAYWWWRNNPSQARAWIESQPILRPEDRTWIFNGGK